MEELINLLKVLETEYLQRKMGSFGCVLYTIMPNYVAIHPNFFTSANKFDCFDWDIKTCNRFLERLIMDMQTTEIYGNYYVMFNNQNKDSIYYMVDVTKHYTRIVGTIPKEDFSSMIRHK